MFILSLQIFRGSVNLSDIVKNVKMSATAVPNPVLDDYPGRTSSIELHQGYWEYLFEERADFEDERTKFHEIADRVDEYGKELSSDGLYSLYVTGHR